MSSSGVEAISTIIIGNLMTTLAAELNVRCNFFTGRPPGAVDREIVMISLP
jgi:hypothetical protein